MEVSTRNREGVTILELRGNLTIGVGESALRDTIQQVLDRHGARILIDLGGVPLIDSSGVGELVAAYTTVTHRGGELKLLHLPPKVHDVLQIAQLFTVFEVHDDENEAVASFRR